MFVSQQEMLLKYLALEIGPGRPHFAKAKDASHCSPKPLPGSSHNNCSATSEPLAAGNIPPMSPYKFYFTHSSCCLETSLAEAEVCSIWQAPLLSHATRVSKSRMTLVNTNTKSERNQPFSVFCPKSYQCVWEGQFHCILLRYTK